MAFVEAPGAHVGVEGPQPEPGSTLRLSNCHQSATDAAAGVIGVDLQLVDPVVRQNEDARNGTAVIGHPDFSLGKDHIDEPPPYLILRVHRRRDLGN